MKKFFVPLLFSFICAFCFWGLAGQAVTLKGGVTYTVETARKEAFANVEYSLPQGIIASNKFDPNFKENKMLIKKGIKETNDRYITYFSDGGYGIVYKNNLYMEYYYYENGYLEHLAKRISLVFPLKKAKYDIKGRLLRIVLSVSSKDSYIFFPDGQLESHWLNDKEYDLNGNIVNQSY